MPNPGLRVFVTFAPVIYSTSRLLVRRFEPRDLMDVFAILSDPEISKYEQWGPFDLEEVRHDLEVQAAVEPGTPEVWNEFAVTLKEGGACIGNISFKPSEPDQGQVEIGFHFGRAYHGKGYGKEAVAGLIDWLWGLKVHRIWAVADTRNVGSWKMMEKLGMRREGHFRQNCLVKGEWADEYLYALLESEWLASRAGNVAV
jgi:RimJ/RimL family protein N-acetyltransferase